MNKKKQKKLESKDWKVGTVSEFLDLTEEEEKLVENMLIRYNIYPSVFEKFLFGFSLMRVCYSYWFVLIFTAPYNKELTTYFFDFLCTG